MCVIVLEIDRNHPSFTFLVWLSSFSREERKKKKKDTASKLQSESRRPRFSARGQKPLRMVDMGSHDAQSAGKSRIYIRPPVS